MIRLTNFADYAVVLMSELAKEKDSRSSAQELSIKTHIPAPTVSKVLNALGQGNLLQSHRGLKGGFSLSRPAAEISVAQIIEAVDGPICLTECSHGDNEYDCALLETCEIRSHWPPINKAVRNSLSAISLDYISQIER
jgi:FeS assembly SUF system regulator